MNKTDNRLKLWIPFRPIGADGKEGPEEWRSIALSCNNCAERKDAVKAKEKGE